MELSKLEAVGIGEALRVARAEIARRRASEAAKDKVIAELQRQNAFYVKELAAYYGMTCADCATSHNLRRAGRPAVVAA